jgi:chromosomal replication initiator protein
MMFCHAHNGFRGIVYPFDFIQTTICIHLKVSKVLLNSNSRKQNIVLARHLSMYFIRKITPFPLTTIGLHTVGKDDATVLHACKELKLYIAKNPK